MTVQSQGPWLQPLDNGNGPIISVNSWGYTTRAGMAGPRLHDNSAQLLFNTAQTSGLSSSGVVVDPDGSPPDPPTAGKITLTVNAYKLKGEKTADLSWSPAEPGLVEIYRDGTRIGTEQIENDGEYLDETGMKGGGTTSWWVCEAGSIIACSDEVTVSW